MSNEYVIGLDYGTNSVRALIVNVANGAEVGTAVWNYAHGTQGVILSRDPNLARQHPADYLTGAETTIKEALAASARARKPDFAPDQVVGIGVDTTGSTPLPVDAERPSARVRRTLRRQPEAMAWLWKDHTGVDRSRRDHRARGENAPAVSRQVRRHLFQRMVFGKILHCLHIAPKVFDAAHSWVECADWIPAMLTGTEAPEHFTAGVCAAGHKAM